MIMFAVMLTLQAQTVTQSGDARERTIVVTARSTAETARALAACLARQCPPPDDIDASLTHAENLFVSGDYAGARQTLGRSRSRNMRHAAQFPVEVADLARAYGRMSAFDGRDAGSRISQIDSLDVLKAGLDRHDVRVLRQRLLVADEFVRQGRIPAADDIYRTVERQADAAKLPMVRGLAMLRQAVVYTALAGVYSHYRVAARHRIARIDATTDPALAPFRDVTPVLRAQIAVRSGDPRAIDRVIADLAAKPFSRPTLVYAPAVEVQERPDAQSGVVVNTGEARPQWIDVAFEIMLDGRVKDIEILRRSDTIQGDWPDSVREAIQKRRYAPLATTTDPALLQRTERFSLVFPVASTKGSRLPSRSPFGRIVSLDLTIEPKSSVAS